MVFWDGCSPNRDAQIPCLINESEKEKEIQVIKRLDELILWCKLRRTRANDFITTFPIATCPRTSITVSERINPKQWRTCVVCRLMLGTGNGEWCGAWCHTPGYLRRLVFTQFDACTSAATYLAYMAKNNVLQDSFHQIWWNESQKAQFKVINLCFTRIFPLHSFYMSWILLEKKLNHPLRVRILLDDRFWSAGGHKTGHLGCRLFPFYQRIRHTSS